MKTADSGEPLTTPGRGWSDAVITLAYGYVTWLIVWLGVGIGTECLIRMSHPEQNSPGFFNAFGAWDGVWFQRVATDGYQWDPGRTSRVAYFPAFPLLGRWVSQVTGCRPLTGLLVISYASFAAALIVGRSYVRDRLANDEADLTLLALLLWPTGLFFRMAYSESLLLLLIVVALLGIQRRWPIWVIAVVVGAATATRSVGVALLLPLLWSVWERPRSVFSRLSCAAWAIPLGMWGLLFYMAFQASEFGNPLAFVQTQQHWSQRPDLPVSEKVWQLLILKPVWSVYQFSSEACWMRHDVTKNMALSLHAWNPVYFLACAGFVGWGAFKRWLTPPEWLLSAGLLLIPYWFQSHRMIMLGHGRFTCVVFPMFLVLGKLLARMPTGVVVILGAFAAAQLVLWSALFSAWYRVF